MNRNQNIVLITALLMATGGVVQAGSITQSVFATGTGVGSTAPDSVSIGSDGSVWVAYTNGAASDGTSGSSTVVRYNQFGSVLHQWTIAGNVDGLKVDPTSGNVWALQNNDGNSTLTIINPATNATQLFTYGSSYTNSANRGFDDVVFANGNTYLSETNPASPTDSVVLQLTTPLASPLTVTGLLAAGTITDSDALKLMPNGDLALTGEADQTIVFIHNPGAGQTVTNLALTGVGTGKPDDVIPTTGTAGTIIYADTGANIVYRVVLTGLAVGSVYADVGNSFGSLNTTTGAFTPIFTGVSPHGADFAQAPEPGSVVMMLGGLMLLGLVAWRKKASSL